MSCRRGGSDVYGGAADRYQLWRGAFVGGAAERNAPPSELLVGEKINQRSMRNDLGCLGA